jgi:hypothetical protein
MCAKVFGYGSMGECGCVYTILHTANKGMVSGYANVYVAIVAVRIQEGEKNTHIRKGGRNVQKHI